MTRITTFKATNPIIWALVALVVAGGFFYANHSTIAARFGSKPITVDGSGLEHIPAVTGVDSSAALQW
jgi:hypothetical protein